jgi:hypothetical protein
MWRCMQHICCITSAAEGAGFHRILATHSPLSPVRPDTMVKCDLVAAGYDPWHDSCSLRRDWSDFISEEHYKLACLSAGSFRHVLQGIGREFARVGGGHP